VFPVQALAPEIDKAAGKARDAQSKSVVA